MTHSCSFKRDVRGIKGNDNRAIVDLNKSLKIDTRDVEAYVFRGGVWVEMEDYDRAIADCNKALEIDPQNVGAYTTKGCLLAFHPDVRCRDRAGGMNLVRKALELEREARLFDTSPRPMLKWENSRARRKTRGRPSHC